MKDMQTIDECCRQAAPPAEMPVEPSCSTNWNRQVAALYLRTAKMSGRSAERQLLRRRAARLILPLQAPFRWRL